MHLTRFVLSGDVLGPPGLIGSEVERFDLLDLLLVVEEKRRVGVPEAAAREGGPGQADAGGGPLESDSRPAAGFRFGASEGSEQGRTLAIPPVTPEDED
jgi:hypothetical protein